MDELLIYLFSKRAHINPVNLTTTQIALETGFSQQSISRKLIEFQQGGLLDRTNGIFLQKKAVDQIISTYKILKDVFEPQPLVFRGKIVSGLGEGKHYLSIDGYKKGIQSALGFAAYPGTLNLKIPESELWKRSLLLKSNSIEIPGFKLGDRTFGGIFAYKVDLNGHTGAIIIPIRTHHGPEFLEIIAPFCIREKFKINDGDELKVRIC